MLFAQESRSPHPAPILGALRVDTIVSGLAFPWGLEILPDGRFLVTEKVGRLRIVTPDGRLSPPIGAVPSVVASVQGGLLDVALDPDFAENQIIYLTYSEPRPGGAATTVARARLGTTRLWQLRVIYRSQPAHAGVRQFGSRIAFRRDGTMLVTIGDRFELRDLAQDLSTGLGKVIRINRDGTIPADNPFVGRRDVLPEIWSYGHRNLTGAAIHPETGELWTVEHGPLGGDELNRVLAGRNYGWPVISYGRHYDGSVIGEGTAKRGLEQPVFYWDPVIAPGAITFYTGDAFPGWKGNVLIAGLRSGSLIRLTLVNGSVIADQRYRPVLERLRDVRQGPDGLIYVVTDSPTGEILRLSPAY